MFGAHLSIGQFAKSVRLSVKALRRYDAEGLLRPALVDPETGYRYYAPEQSRTAVTIALLRRLDVSLPAIRALLDADARDERRSLLELERARLERELRERQAALASVERLLETGELLPYPVRLVEEPMRRVAALGFQTTTERLEEDTTAAVRALVDVMRVESLRSEEPVQCLMFEPDAEGQRSLTVCIGLPEGTPRAASVRVERLPGGPCAGTRHIGSYLQLGLAHFALHAWVRERGHAPSGPIREIYLNDPDEVPTGELVTDLLLPIRVD